MKNVARKIASMVLAVAVTSNLFTVGGIVGKKNVEAATSKWVLVSTRLCHNTWLIFEFLCPIYNII